MPTAVHATGGYTFNPYTGEYVSAEPAWATAQREEAQQYMHDRTQAWMRRHYVPGKTVISDRGDMIITENGVQRIIPNPYRNNTVIEPAPEAGQADRNQSDDMDDDR